MTSTCPNQATCPSINPCGDGTCCPSINPHGSGYVIVGTITTPEHAHQHGGNVGDDEAAILLPADVMAAHEKPLRDEIARLKAELESTRLDALQAAHGHAADIEQLDHLAERVKELKGNLSAIRSWTRSRLGRLDEAQRDWRQSSENAAKIAILDDLTRVLDHLATIPEDGRA